MLRRHPSIHYTLRLSFQLLVLPLPLRPIYLCTTSELIFRGGIAHPLTRALLLTHDKDPCYETSRLLLSCWWWLDGWLCDRGKLTVDSSVEHLLATESHLFTPGCVLQIPWINYFWIY